ncbi:MAG: hypothetical protein BWY59_02509 [Verrucomicrobia bacterium ADurb.Bin345]|nr:MAG: hypothetical protein BWY59_02509 [Verrucomicrobia bacterium ADurb.Bin345]
MRGAIGGPGDLANLACRVLRQGSVHKQHAGIPEDRGQDVVEIVRDASGKASHGLHLLEMSHLGLEVEALGDIHSIGMNGLGVRYGEERPAERAAADRDFDTLVTLARGQCFPYHVRGAGRKHFARIVLAQGDCHFTRGAVVVGQASVCGEFEHGVRIELGKRGELPYRFLGLFALRDVPDTFDCAHDPAARIVKGSCGHPDIDAAFAYGGEVNFRNQRIARPFDVSVVALHLLIRFQHEIHKDGPPLAIERHRVLVIALADHVPGGDTCQGLDRPVPGNHLALAVDRKRRIRQETDDGLEPLFRFAKRFLGRYARGNVPACRNEMQNPTRRILDRGDGFALVVHRAILAPVHELGTDDLARAQFGPQVLVMCVVVMTGLQDARGLARHLLGSVSRELFKPRIDILDHALGIRDHDTVRRLLHGAGKGAQPGLGHAPLGYVADHAQHLVRPAHHHARLVMAGSSLGGEIVFVHLPFSRPQPDGDMFHRERGDGRGQKLVHRVPDDLLRRHGEIGSAFGFVVQERAVLPYPEHEIGNRVQHNPIPRLALAQGFFVPSTVDRRSQESCGRS